MKNKIKIITDFISDKTCFGCGMCVTICPKKAIDMKLNVDGFFSPTLVNAEVCNKCGLCTKVCSYIDSHETTFSYPLNAFGAWSLDNEIRKKSSSGGVAFELGRYLLSQGYKVCSVRFDAQKNRAEHYIASSLEELVSSIGSKYIQSYTIDAFRSINRKEKYLIIGTPCQVDSFKKYATLYHCEENFVFVDFFCHGVPSKFIWDKYVDDAERTVGKITYASWRNKFKGWHDSWSVGINGEKVEKDKIYQLSYSQLIKETETYIDSRFTQGDIFYRMFLEHHCMSSACHNDCKFKKYHSSADIRLGDFWGKTYAKNEEGVSSILCFTKKGEEILQNSNLTFVNHDPEIVCEGQLAVNASASFMRPWFMNKLRNKKSTLADIKRLLTIFSIIMLPKRIYNKVKFVLR